MVGMVGVISRMGGTQGIINILAKRANTARGASIVTAIMGMLLFFDDYANAILVGSTARPLTDQYKVSREKLAYLVDSTAAPIAGLAVLSTWIGYEAGLFQEALNGLNVAMSGYEAFFHALPFRFYCIFTIIFVFVNVIMDRDFGPMHRAQKRALTTGKVTADDAELKSSTAVEKTKVRKGVVPRWHNAAIPLALVLLVMWVGFYYSGATALNIPLKFGDLFHFETLRRCFSEANNIRVLALGGGMGLLCSIVLAVTQNILSLKQSLAAFWHSFKAILVALTILLLAWAIQKTCDDLGTSIYLSALLKDVVSPMMLPVVIFVRRPKKFFRCYTPTLI